VIDHRAPPPRVPTDLVEDDAVVFSFNDPQAIVRTPRVRTLLVREPTRGPGRGRIRLVRRDTLGGLIHEYELAA
jgi:hypothetical protein